VRRIHLTRRRRRRLAWLAAIVGVAAGVASLVVIIGNTGKNLGGPITSKPPQVYHQPATVALGPSDKREVVQITRHFVDTAVARVHLGDSYLLVGPSLREGMSRKSWLTGTIPVIPFPVARILAMRQLYSFQDDVAFDVILIGRRGSVPAGKTFIIELKRLGPGGHKHWLVESWVPEGISASSGPGAPRSKNSPPPPPIKPRLSAVWLLVPLGIFALVIVIPLALALRGWREGARARKRHALAVREDYYSSSTRPS
jgi:hypothetical protein